VFGKNPIHYAAQSGYTRCYNVGRLLLCLQLGNVENYEEFVKQFEELQVLEIKEERKSDPRKYRHVIEEFEHLLSQEVYGGIVRRFKERLRAVRVRVLTMRDAEGNTPLHIASYSGDFLATEYFLKIGGDPTAQNNRKQRPLDIAKNKLVRKVLSNLNKAAYDCDIHNLKYLVNCGSKIDQKISIFGEAPIHQTIKSDKQEKAETLTTILDCGADVNLIDSNGWTALHHAAEKGDTNTAQILLAHQANVNAYSNARKTPLHLAAFNNKPEMIQLLIDNKAEKEFESEDKCTALHYAARKGNLACVKVLLNAAVNIYKQDKRLWTPLHYAAYNGHKEVVYYLLYWDADYEKLRYMKNTQNKKAEEIVTGPDVKFSFKLIWQAAAKGDLDTVRILHREGQPLDEPTHAKMNTALHLVLSSAQLLGCDEQAPSDRSIPGRQWGEEQHSQQG
jgi:ankyrin repeat protein